MMTDTSPIYLQILLYIKRGIIAGSIVDGAELPSRRVLSALLGVNPNTVQKAYKLLEGARGTTPAQMDQIQETLLRLSQLVTDYPFIDELDINPLLISEKTGEGIAVDGRIKVRLEEAMDKLGGACLCGSCHGCCG